MVKLTERELQFLLHLRFADDFIPFLFFKFF